MDHWQFWNMMPSYPTTKMLFTPGRWRDLPDAKDALGPAWAQESKQTRAGHLGQFGFAVLLHCTVAPRWLMVLHRCLPFGGKIAPKPVMGFAFAGVKRVRAMPIGLPLGGCFATGSKVDLKG